MIAREARARGESESTVRVYYDLPVASNMTALLAGSSIVVVSPTRTTLRVVRDGIFTVQFFTAERWLRQKAAIDAKRCGDWAGPSPRVGEVFTEFLKGTAVIDGVRIRETTFEGVEFDTGQRYLLFVERCANGHLELPYLSDSILRISADGKLHAPGFRPNTPPALHEVVKLGTLKRLEEELRRFPAR